MNFLWNGDGIGAKIMRGALLFLVLVIVINIVGFILWHTAIFSVKLVLALVALWGIGKLYYKLKSIIMPRRGLEPPRRNPH